MRAGNISSIWASAAVVTRSTQVLYSGLEYAAPFSSGEFKKKLNGGNRMRKSVFLAALVALALIVSPSWAMMGENGTEGGMGMPAQSNYGYPNQYGHDHNQMHGGGGGGCGGGNHNTSHNMRHNSNDYQHHQNHGYQDPNNRYQDSQDRNDDRDHAHSGGGHNH